MAKKITTKTKHDQDSIMDFLSPYEKISPDQVKRAAKEGWKREKSEEGFSHILFKPAKNPEKRFSYSGTDARTGKPSFHTYNKGGVGMTDKATKNQYKEYLGWDNDLAKSVRNTDASPNVAKGKKLPTPTVKSKNAKKPILAKRTKK